MQSSVVMIEVKTIHSLNYKNLKKNLLRTLTFFVKDQHNTIFDKLLTQFVAVSV